MNINSIHGQGKDITRNATLCNNHDDFLHLRFILKISLLSEAYLEPSQTSLITSQFHSDTLYPVFYLPRANEKLEICMPV